MEPDVHSRGKSLCVCENCYMTYFIDMDDCRLLPTMRARPYTAKEQRNKIDKPPKTWSDWVDHISTHCPDCRIQIIPQSCVGDLERHWKKHRE